MRLTKAELRNEILVGFVLINLVIAALCWLLVKAEVFTADVAASGFIGNLFFQIGYTIAELRYRN